MWRDIGSYDKATRFYPLVVESRRALKLFSDLALIVLSSRLFQLGAIRFKLIYIIGRLHVAISEFNLREDCKEHIYSFT